jgi:type I restriction enzyme S subunit
MIPDNYNFLSFLPVGWKYDRLKDVATLRNSKTDVASEEEDYLELEDIESGTGRILNRQNTVDVESAVTLFKKGDVLFGKLRPYLEKYYQAEFDGKCTGEILAFKPERINSRFLFYCVASPWFIERCNVLAYGAKMPRVNWPTQLSQFYLPLPPLPLQERIAAYLDASCSAIDATIAAKGHQLEILDELRKTVFTRAITKGLNPDIAMRKTGVDWIPEIPSHWKISKLNTLFRFRKGDRAMELTQKYIAEHPGEFPVFSGQTDNDGLMGRIDSFEFDFASPVIFVTTVGAKAMTTRIVSGKFNLSQNCALIIPWHRGVNVDYYESAIQALFDFERRSIALTAVRL